jgi:hypothetical protein
LVLTICGQLKIAMLADQFLAGHEGSAEEGDEGGLGRAAVVPQLFCRSVRFRGPISRGGSGASQEPSGGGKALPLGRFPLKFGGCHSSRSAPCGPTVPLGELAAAGKLLWVYSSDCGGERDIDPASLPLPASFPVPEVGSRMKCSACASRKINTKPQLYPGDGGDASAAAQTQHDVRRCQTGVGVLTIAGSPAGTIVQMPGRRPVRAVAPSGSLGAE